MPGSLYAVPLEHFPSAFNPRPPFSLWTRERRKDTTGQLCVLCFLYSFRYIMDLYHFERRHISWRTWRAFFHYSRWGRKRPFSATFSRPFLSLSSTFHVRLRWLGLCSFFVVSSADCEEKKIAFFASKLMVMIAYIVYSIMYWKCFI